MSFEGTGVALITPFNDDLSIDFTALEKIINHTIEGGVDFLVAMGTTGEPATLSKQEKNDIIDFCLQKINKRVPLVVGAGGNNTNEVVAEVQQLEAKGNIAGILSVAPYYNKPSQKGIFEHYKAIANATSLPVIIYNVPGRTASNISPQVALDLANECSNIVALKEASGDFGQIMQVIKNAPKNLNMLSGDDALTLPMISLGTSGVISVIANSHPKQFSSLVKAALKGDFESANKYQYQLLDYIDSLFTEGSPSGVKAAMEIMGLCKKNVRLPLAPVSDEHYAKISELLKDIN